jgi:cyclopropane fatty-acyl-phospholipid synthase-like methyltransferase
MVKQWNDYFKPESILDLGCGRGCYLYFWEWFVKEQCCGIEISEWAVKNKFCRITIINDDISKLEKCEFKENDWDLITAIDVLEHLDDEQLDKTLNNMAKYGKKFLFSIPFEGDPNLEADNTHKQFHDKQWWFDKIQSYGIIIKETPKHWLFKEQILVGEKMTSQGFRKKIEDVGLLGEEFK